MSNDQKGDGPELIKNNNIGDEGDKAETRATVSTEPRYPPRERKTTVRLVVNAQSRVGHVDETTVNEALSGSDVD